MSSKRTAPYGTWVSPVTAELITARTVGLSAVSADGDAVYWLEARPNEAGRSTLMRWTESGGAAELTPSPANVGSRVHEYGGGAYAAAGGPVVWSEKTDGSVWLARPGEAARCIAAVAGCRYGDFAFDPSRGRVLAVREDHRAEGRPGGPEAAIVALDLSPGLDCSRAEGEVLVIGPDFLTSPRLSPSGAALAWLAWDHPDMPWDGTRLYCAALDGSGRPTEPALIAGGEAEAIVQPAWSPGGRLCFSSDRSGWWNLYEWSDGRVRALCPVMAEIGGPHWLLGQRFYDFLSDGRIVAVVVEAGERRIGVIDAGRLERLGLGSAQEAPAPFGDGFVFVSTPPDAPPAVLRVAGLPGTVAATIARSGPAVLGPNDISLGQPISFPAEDGSLSHAFFYPPRNAGFEAPAGERPPLIVTCHGGPTGMAGNAFSLAIHWWTTRGFAVVDVNYGGSSGYGRAYRERLDGKWGVIDVADCVAACRFLAECCLVDPARIAIRGGSAGGYTTLAALTGSDVFKAGASYFGIADLELLAADTHKFESHYLDRLVGKLPEDRPVYRARSPIHRIERLNAPVIFFQGLDDKVVPPNQAQTMVDAMAARGLPVACYFFAGEAHGFRKAETIRRTLELELGFYGRIFGFTPPGLGEAVKIRNLDEAA